MLLKYKINDQISNNSILHDINDITEQFCHTPDGLLAIRQVRANYKYLTVPPAHNIINKLLLRTVEEYLNFRILK